MPFDSLPQETKADPFTLEGLIAWLETKDPATKYNFCISTECLLARWHLDCGVQLRFPIGRSYPTGISPYDGVFARVANDFKDETFAGALRRARQILAERSP